jgi:hypothetical protein
MTTENTTETETTTTTKTNSTKPAERSWGEKAKGAAMATGDVIMNAAGLFGAGLMVSMGAMTGIGFAAKVAGTSAKSATNAAE